MARSIVRGVRPFRRRVVGQRHVPHAARVEFAQHREVVVDGMPAFDSQQHGDFIFRPRRPDFFGRCGERQIAAMNFDLLQRGIEQIPRAPRRRAAGNFHGHPQGEKDRLQLPLRATWGYRRSLRRRGWLDRIDRRTGAAAYPRACQIRGWKNESRAPGEKIRQRAWW